MDEQNTIIAGLAALAAQKEKANPLQGSERILVVDDEPLILAMAKQGLEIYGYQVETAESAAAAIQLLVGGFKPHIMCCDIVMPGSMNGVELARQIHNLLPEVHILLVSGYGADSIDGSTNQDGFRIMSKPYTIDLLTQRIRNILDGNL
jgi:CheY-like chemotaxis protein